MKYLIAQLHLRSPILFWFGLACLLAGGVCLLLSRYTHTQILGVNAWYKPFKFCISTTLYAWAMAWYIYYLPAKSTFNATIFGWAVVVLLGCEIVYIMLQAFKGQLSHYNISTPTYAFLFSMMAAAATLVSLYTAYIAVLFFVNDFDNLPLYYVWSIRIGLVLFVVFSLQGFAMGARLSHTVGSPNANDFPSAHTILPLPLLNWSMKYGDLRIAHFVGMHALQLLPLLSYYIIKNTKYTFALGLLYTILAIFTLIQALQGKPFFKNYPRFLL